MECPSEETLLAFVDGELAAPQRQVVDAHLGACAPCMRLVAATLKSGPEVTPDLGGTQQGASEQAPAEPLGSGGRVGRYVVLAPIGAGGMGVVYAAYDPELHRQVALKLLRPAANDRAGGPARLLREAQAMARLSHPNVVAVYDAGTFGEQVFIAMELASGGTLAGWRARDLGWRAVVRVFLRAGRGLQAAHAAGLVHRDFKPENVLIDEDGRVLVTDFGLARLAEAAAPEASAGALEAPAHSPLTQTGALVGSPAYMAPEQLLGSPADARSDIFSFCVCLHEILCGERPFAGATLAELRAEVTSGHMREIPRGVRVPSFLRALLARGLRVRPEERYPTMAALLEELEHGGLRRTRRWLAGVGLVAIAASAAGIVVDVRSRDPARICPSAEPQVAGVWSPARKSELERAFLATGLRDASDQLSTAVRGLDTYGAGWAAMQADACQAVRVRHEESEAILTLRKECLAQRLEEMTALISLLGKADAALVPRARSAVAGLTPLASCRNGAQLAAGERAPADPRLPAALRALADARAHTLVGAFQRSIDLLGPVKAAAQELRYSALEAEALLLQGQDENFLSHFQAAERALRDAALLAGLARRDDLAAKAFTQLIYVSGVDLDHVDEALRFSHFAQVAIERLSGAADLESWREQMVGAVLAEHGRAAEALPHFQHALQLAEASLGPDAPQNNQVIEALATGLFLTGRYDEALPLYRRSLALSEKIFPPGHPQIAQTVGSIGETLMRLHHRAEAEPLLRRSLALWETALGPGNEMSANARATLARLLREGGSATAALPLAQAADDACKKPESCQSNIAASAAHELGASLLALNRFADAREPLSRAVQIRTKVAHAEVAESQFALAQALWATPTARPDAFELARTARTNSAARKSPLLPEIESWLAERR